MSEANPKKRMLLVPKQAKNCGPSPIVVVQSYRDGEAEFSVSQVLRNRGLRAEAPVSTWVHELGHQMHFADGGPRRPAGLPSLSLYGGVNFYEWHAEHFTMWLFDRESLAEVAPDIAKYFDELMERLIS